ncbi:hypothetical protein N9900_00750, partial [bacterium]|nr:hypothetical protein [bacterium]
LSLFSFLPLSAEARATSLKASPFLKNLAGKTAPAPYHHEKITHSSLRPSPLRLRMRRMKTHHPASWRN